MKRRGGGEAEDFGFHLVLLVGRDYSCCTCVVPLHRAGHFQHQEGTQRPRYANTHPPKNKQSACIQLLENISLHPREHRATAVEHPFVGAQRTLRGRKHRKTAGTWSTIRRCFKNEHPPQKKYSAVTTNKKVASTSTRVRVHQMEMPYKKKPENIVLGRLTLPFMSRACALLRKQPLASWNVDS